MDKTNTKSKEKNKTKMVQGTGFGFGLGGLVVVGGALAVAGLMAAFAFKRKKIKGSNQNPTKGSIKASQECFKDWRKKKNEDQGSSQGLRFLLQNSSSTTLDTSSYSGQGTSTMSAIQEERHDTSKIIPVTDDFDALQEKEDDPILVETTDEEVVHIVEDRDYDEVEYVDNSEDTGESSMESHPRPIWPTELVNDITPEEEEDQAEKSGEEDKTEEGTEKHIHLNSSDVVFNNVSGKESKTTQDEGREETVSLEMNEEIARWSKFWVRILSLLIMLLLLLFSPVSGKATSAVHSLFSEDQGTVIKHLN